MTKANRFKFYYEMLRFLLDKRKESTSIRYNYDDYLFYENLEIIKVNIEELVELNSFKTGGGEYWWRTASINKQVSVLEFIISDMRTYFIDLFSNSNFDTIFGLAIKKAIYTPTTENILSMALEVQFQHRENPSLVNEILRIDFSKFNK